MDKVEEKISVEQGNKLIAEFLNAPIDSKGAFESAWVKVPNKELSKWTLLSDLKYHSSWDWLMPVYCKLNQVKMVTSLRLHWGKLMGTIVRRIIECDIREAKKAVVKTIQWYNANTKT